ncbi:MAG: protein phosphatase 2C domain-containing protein [Alphaproteobacteria bacterium]|nr:protein phosphatase 2C domain-containing protein [Alphaproteobacteria bacterium]
MSWIAAVESRRGRAHRRRRQPCQDFGAIKKLDDGLLIGALADGAGSAVHAHRGARRAVCAVIKQLTGTFSGGAPTAKPDDRLLRMVLCNAFSGARATLGALARAEGVRLDDFACTLIAVVAAPDWLAAMQLGDGLIVARPHGAEYRLLFRPDKGEYANETTFLTDRDALDAARFTCVTGPQAFVCAATDGLEDVSIERRAMLPHAPFFRPLDDYILAARDERQARHDIREFLASQRLEAHSDDDKTLLLSGFRRAGTQ